MSEQPLSYEEKVDRLNRILTQLDNSETPIDELADNVKEGVRLIKEMNEILRKVEMEVKDAFKELESVQLQNQPGS